MLEAAAWWGIRRTTGDSGSRTSRDSCTRGFHRRSSSPCLSTEIIQRAKSPSMKDSKRMANKRVKSTPYSAPDPRRYQAFEFCHVSGIFEFLKIIVIRNISGKSDCGLEMNETGTLHSFLILPFCFLFVEYLKVSKCRLLPEVVLGDSRSNNIYFNQQPSI